MLSRDFVPIAQQCPLGAVIGKPLPIAVDNRIDARGWAYNPAPVGADTDSHDSLQICFGRFCAFGIRHSRNCGMVLV
jgi:hypothetical protein